jgi:lipopolysaccharide/colanic/teichoic acid biosynthesis glycosyltransferase
VLLKFRTMTDAYADGKLKPDFERMTRLGRLLRKARLDLAAALERPAWRHVDRGREDAAD